MYDPNRKTDPNWQLDRSDIANMTPWEIEEARQAGRLTALLADPDFVREGRKAQPEQPAKEASQDASVAHQLSRDDLRSMSMAEIEAARQAGKLNALLGIVDIDALGDIDANGLAL